jgi:hypothetical protein
MSAEARNGSSGQEATMNERRKRVVLTAAVTVYRVTEYENEDGTWEAMDDDLATEQEFASGVVLTGWDGQEWLPQDGDQVLAEALVDTAADAAWAHGKQIAEGTSVMIEHEEAQ